MDEKKILKENALNDLKTIKEALADTEFFLKQHGAPNACDKIYLAAAALKRVKTFVENTDNLNKKTEP